MKLLISKELATDNIDKMLEVLKSELDTEVIFFDASLNKDFVDTGAINVDYEDRNNVPVLALKEAVARDCQASLFIPKNCEPKQGLVDELLQPLIDDNNITATYSDYSLDGTNVLQAQPIIFCRRLEPDIENLYDLQQTKGIVKYIPLSLYNVLLQKN